MAEQLDRNEALVPLACLRENVIKLHTEHQVPQPFVDGLIEAIEGLYDNMRRQLKVCIENHEEVTERICKIARDYEADRLDILSSTMEYAQTIDSIEKHLPPSKDVHLLSHDGAIEVIRDIMDEVNKRKQPVSGVVVLKGDGTVH